MAFNSYFREVLLKSNPVWSNDWIDYDGLHGLVTNLEKKKSDMSEYESILQSRSEVNFFRELKREIEKVDYFLRRMIHEINIRVRSLGPKINSSNLLGFYKEILFLQRYLVLNYIGLSNILFEHDKITGYSIQEALMSNSINPRIIVYHNALNQIFLFLEDLFVKADLRNQADFLYYRKLRTVASELISLKTKRHHQGSRRMDQVDKNVITSHPSSKNCELLIRPVTARNIVVNSPIKTLSYDDNSDLTAAAAILISFNVNMDSTSITDTATTTTTASLAESLLTLDKDESDNCSEVLDTSLCFEESEESGKITSIDNEVAKSSNVGKSITCVWTATTSKKRRRVLTS